ncbi:hypothetical protein AAHC03_01288 [Spirometra sp. Aus1]
MIDLSATNSLKGYLYKWTNYLKGYQKRWGTINLANAKIVSTGSTTFVISNSSTQTFHLKASNEIEQKKWVAALTIGKAKALALGKNDEDSDGWTEEDESESDWHLSRLALEDGPRLIEQALSQFDARISDLQHYQDTLKRKSDDLQKSVSELEAATEPSEVIENFANVKDRIAVYRVASMAMVNSCADFLAYARIQSKRWHRCFTAQADRRGRLEQLVEDLAKQLRQLETQVRQKNSCAFPGAIPGQAVAVSSSQRLEAARNKTEVGGVKGEPARGGTLTLKTRTSRMSGDEAGTGIISSDDEDFFDAEETGSQFDVTLPLFASPTTDKASNAATATSTGEEGGPSETVIEDSSVLVGTDLAMEYESDVDDSEALDEDRESLDELLPGAGATQTGRRQFTRAMEARVIQKYGWGTTASTESSVVGDSAGVHVPVSPPNGGKIVPVRKPIKRRTTIPPKPNISLNLWSILKNCIGKELTKIAMPVNFSEPLSMLQRLTENFEYSDCLDRAAACSDPLEQLAYVAAFTISSYACTAIRVNKPFNPLLGETYECDRTDDMGWRSLAEQVSHHPPVAALHCESDAWYTWFDFSMSTKFRGKYLQIEPIGTCHLVLRRTGHHFTWNKIPLTVHNIIVGKLWIDNSGVIDVTNHTTGDQCRLTVKPYSYFSSEPPRRVTGAVSDSKGHVCGIINGTWDEYIEYAPVVSSSRGDGRKPVLETGPARQLWRARPLPPDAEKMYNFTQLAIELNDPAESEDVCPTDARLRPDQRLMEQGRWDEANLEKVRLEEKQRARRRQMALENLSHLDPATSQSSSDVQSASGIPSNLQDIIDRAYEPIWFERVVDDDTKQGMMRFKGTYWDCKARKDWSMCPDIY